MNLQQRINHASLEKVLYISIKQDVIADVKEIFRLFPSSIHDTIDSRLGWNPPIHLAAWFGSFNVMNLLLNEYGVSLNQLNPIGDSILHLAAENNQNRMVEYLLRRGMNPELKDGKGQNCLHFAMEYCFDNISNIFHRSYPRSFAKMLNDANDHGITPFHLAVRYGREHFSSDYGLEEYGRIAWLIDCGARIDILGKDGKSIMHFALQDKSLQSIEHLIRLANRCYSGLGVQLLNQATENGFTPLHMLALQHEEGVEELIRLGSKSMDQPNNLGHTPLYYAMFTENREMVRVFLALGAQTLLEPSKEFPIHLLEDEPDYLWREPLEVEYVLNVRFNTYFADSLAFRLLLELGV